MSNYYMNIANNISEGMQDYNYSRNLKSKLDTDTINANEISSDLIETNINNRVYKEGSQINIYDSLYHASNLRRDRNEIYGKGSKDGNLFEQTFRFGVYNPYGTITSAREFLFFTKPDLHIVKAGDSGINVKTTQRTYKLNDGLQSYFWQDMYKNKRRIIKCLQNSFNDQSYPDPFNHLLQNTVTSNLDLPSLSSTSVETATNSYGVAISYRGSSEASDDGPEFSLEFKDDRYLNVYSFFRAYEEYETLKKHGTIRPQLAYIVNKIIHDQFSIYKFIVDEDMETIIYWGKYYGVYPTSLPRDAFSSANFQDGLTFNINFKASFYEDMRPEILYDFNTLGIDLWTQPSMKRIDIYNDVMGRADGRAAKVARVEMIKGDPRADQNPNGYYYKLSWKGDDIV